MMGLRWIGGLVLLSRTICSPSLTVAGPSSPVSSVSISVTSDTGVDFLSVMAREVSLRFLLAEIATRAGFQLTELVPIERRVSVVYNRSPLDQALTRILQEEGLSFIFIYNGREFPKLKRVLLLGAHAKGLSSPTAQSPALSDGREDFTLSSEGPDQIVPENAEVFDPDAPLEQLLEWTAHGDPRMRTAALEALTLHPQDEQARRKLMDGMKDSDPHIRSVVIGLLGPFVTQWLGAEEVVMEALTDPAPSVRRLARLVLWEASSSRIADALNLALQGNDAGMRASELGSSLLLTVHEDSLNLAFSPCCSLLLLNLSLHRQAGRTDRRVFLQTKGSPYLDKLVPAKGSPHIHGHCPGFVCSSALLLL
jgi:hypothetical protein